jgi:hypothetical protein
MTVVEEDEGIPDFIEPRGCGDAQHGRFILLPIGQRPIRSGEDYHSISGIAGIRRVDGRRYAAVVDDTTAPTPRFIDEARSGRERNGMLVPVEQVRRADMAPMDGVVHRRDRVGLEEDVIAAVNSAQTIGIIQPSPSRPDMEGREAGISHEGKRYARPASSMEKVRTSTLG